MRKFLKRSKLSESEQLFIPGIGYCIPDNGGYTPVNRYDKNSNHRSAVSAADMESHSGDAPFRAQETPRLDTPCRVRVHSKRRRRTGDVDGISAKYAIDGLVRAGILLDDSPEFIEEITFTQEHVKKGTPECTIITLTYETDGRSQKTKKKS